MWKKKWWISVSLARWRTNKSLEPTRQIPEDEQWITSAQWYIDPPLPFSDLIKIFDDNTIVYKSVDIFAKLVSNWFNVVAKDWKNEENSEKQLEEARLFFENINDEKTFEDIVYAWIVDYRVTWNLAFEVWRAKVSDWKALKLYNVPIDTIRVAKWEWFDTWDKFIQIINWAASTKFNKYMASPDDRRKMKWYEPSENDIIWVKSASPSSFYYGSSPSSTLLETYLILKYIKTNHLNEFEWGLMSKIALLISWWNISEDTKEMLEQFLSRQWWVKWGKTIPIIQSTWTDAKIDIKEIWASIKDWDFLALSEKLEEEVIVAFWVPEIMLWINKNTTQANQEAQERKFFYDEVLPMKNTICKIFTRMLNEDLWLDKVMLVPEVKSFEDKKDKAEMIVSLISMWTITINEWRQMLWFNKLTDEKWNEIQWGNVNFIKMSKEIIPVTKDFVEMLEWTNATQQAQKLLKNLTEANKAKKEADYNEVVRKQTDGY